MDAWDSPVRDYAAFGSLVVAGAGSLFGGVSLATGAASVVAESLLALLAMALSPLLVALAVVLLFERLSVTYQPLPLKTMPTG